MLSRVETLWHAQVGLGDAHEALCYMTRGSGIGPAGGWTLRSQVSWRYLASGVREPRAQCSGLHHRRVVLAVVQRARVCSIAPGGRLGRARGPMLHGSRMWRRVGSAGDRTLRNQVSWRYLVSGVRELGAEYAALQPLRMRLLSSRGLTYTIVGPTGLTLPLFCDIMAEYKRAHAQHLSVADLGRAAGLEVTARMLRDA